MCMCNYIFFFFLFFQFYFIFKLYIIVLVLPNIEMNPPQVYMCSPSWTLLPPPSPYHPSGPSQCTSPKHPASCIEAGLATRFLHDILHVSLPFSQIFPPSPSPTESIRLFYTSVSLLLYSYLLKSMCVYVTSLSSWVAINHEFHLHPGHSHFYPSSHGCLATLEVLASHSASHPQSMSIL